MPALSLHASSAAGSGCGCRPYCSPGIVRGTRTHPDRSQAALAASLKEFGAARSIVTDSDGIVRAGNGTLAAAKAAGIKKATVIETDGEQVIVVRRKDLSGERALAYAIADNRTGELSHFDHEALRTAMEQLAQHAIVTGSSALVDAAAVL